MEVLYSEDVAAIDSKDPCFLSGFTLFYDKTIQFDLRVDDASIAFESLRLRILNLDEFQGKTIKIELSSEKDIFFHYTCRLNMNNFSELLNMQKLMIELASVPLTLSELLDNCMRDPRNFIAVFVMDRDGNGRLDIIQNFSHKIIELLSLKFVESKENEIRQQVIYRYEALKSKFGVLGGTLRDLNGFFKRKDQALFTALAKAIKN